jgi:16S rRNA (guanine527-N7)-methyltransferase
LPRISPGNWPAERQVRADIAARLKDRAARAGLTVPDSLANPLAIYYEVLDRWNEKINLTSLSDPDEAVDRLLLEPVAAAAHLPLKPRLMDLGSGGGSPAIPLALALNAPELVMVESRHRKAAFLREALREVGIPGAVETVRFEELARGRSFSRAMDVVSMRAVRTDQLALEAIAAFLRAGGIAALFQGPQPSARPEFLPPSLRRSSVHALLKFSNRQLICLERAD